MNAIRASAAALGMIAACLATVPVSAAEVAGVRVEESAQVGGHALRLNGAGVRSRFFVKVYVGALYLDARAPTAAAALARVPPARLGMHLLRELDANTLAEALDEGLRNNLDAGERAAMKPAIDQLSALMRGIGRVREGDVVVLDMLADGLTLSLNGEVRGRVAQADFGRMLLRVWLGDKPADADLKKALLGA